MLGQRRVMIADNGNEFGANALERRQDVEDFHRFPTIREGQYDIIRRNHT